jgi:hypothetical protein
MVVTLPKLPSEFNGAHLIVSLSTIEPWFPFIPTTTDPVGQLHVLSDAPSLFTVLSKVVEPAFEPSEYVCALN